MMMSDGGGVGGGGGGGGAPSGGSAAPTATPAGGGGTLDHGGGGESEAFSGFELDSVELEGGGEAGGGEAPEVSEPTAQPPPTQPPPQQPQRQAAQQPGYAPFEQAEFTIDNIDHYFAEQANAMVGHLASTMFTLSPQESEALVTSPETVLPHLLARGLYHALRSVPAQIRKFVPGMIESQTRTMAAEASAESQLFGSWPGLRGQDQAIIHALGAVQAMKPNVTMEEMIQLGGQMACVALGLDPSTVRANGVAGPKRGRGGQPFRPAGAGTGSPSAGTPAGWIAGRSSGAPWPGAGSGSPCVGT